MNSVYNQRARKIASELFPHVELSPERATKRTDKKQKRLKDLNSSLKKLASFRDSWSAIRDVNSHTDLNDLKSEKEEMSQLP